MEKTSSPSTCSTSQLLNFTHRGVLLPSSSHSLNLLSSAVPAALPGLYIHVPFCRTKCIYCDFYSITDEAVIDRWLAALEREMALYSDFFASFDSLYIGGGTPSLLNERQFESLFDAARRHFSFGGDTETTVEVNPDDVTQAKLSCFRALGVNRISFGVQSFDDKMLSFLRRRHTAAEAERAVLKARSAGFDNIGVDLIYGLPGQGEKSWLVTLERALSLVPQHLSCYQLTVGKETPLGRMVAGGEVRRASEDKERRLFLVTSQFLETHGFIHYEVSNFTASAGCMSRHNQKYWTHVPYLGLGPAAHSFDGHNRWWNYRSVEQYCVTLEQDGKPLEGQERLTDKQLRLEKLSLGLRTSQGVKLDLIDREALPALGQLERSGLISVEEGRVKPTRKGYLMADSLPMLLC